MDLQLKDKTAFISGSTSGIGFATAKLFAAEGATVIINGRSQATVDKALDALRHAVPGAMVSGSVADFGDVAQIDSLLHSLPEVDILINNVGIFKPVPFAEITDADWQRMFEINVMSGIRLGRHFLPGMLARNWGRIIFISSESGVFIPQEMIHYGMSKTAQIAVARGMAELTSGTGVTVNSILPGPTRSDGVGTFLADLAAVKGIPLEEAEKAFFREDRPTSLIQRFASVEEIANTIVYYASPRASATNGAAIRVEGGLVRSIT